MAKESTELAEEDERLELMEFALSSKGLPSIMSLHHETLQYLELFKSLRELDKRKHCAGKDK
ncbi:Homeobox-DDT domain protein RLT1 [Cucurbita argyrosperma subsp. argyrosperma]|nr:Homeobox-DDT domain protein RLT1 [Cucurbita argyrosperma subsp. argyrosperma]